MLVGKHLFIWKIDQIESGNTLAIATKAKAAGYDGLCVKIIDGLVPQNQGKIANLIMECQSRGLSVSLWGYFYGISTTNANAEASAAATLINSYLATYGIDIFLIDVEAEYKATGAKLWATAFMATLKAKVAPIVDFGLCSYRFPSVHPEIPWLEFLDKCDFHAPQVYWEGSHDPAFQLEKSYNELTALKDLPFVGAGSAYCNGGWCATPAECLAFAAKSEEMGLSGVLYWAWHSAVGIPGMWDALASIDYDPEIPPTPPPDPVSPELVKAHVLMQSPPQNVNVRKSPKYGSTIYFQITPNKNIWVTKIYPYANGQQWVGIIVPNGGDGSSDLAGFAAFTYNFKDLLAWGWV